MSEIIGKLKFKTDKKTLLLNVPTGLKKLFAGLSASAKAPEQVIAFAENTTQLKTIMSMLQPLLLANTLCWIAYPKGSAGIKTDLSKDKGWESIQKLGWEGMSLISIDETWSAMRFKPSDKIQRQPSNHTDIYLPYIDQEQHTILKLPEDLNKALKQAKLLQEFKALSYSNQK